MHAQHLSSVHTVVSGARPDRGGTLKTVKIVTVPVVAEENDIILACLLCHKIHLITVNVF